MSMPARLRRYSPAMEPPLRVDREAVTEDGCRIMVCGEVDIATVGGLRAALTDAITGPHIRIVILDLKHVTFMDVSGVEALVVAQALAADRGRVIQVERWSPRVIHLLQLCGVADDFGLSAAA
jgi:anti-anti-sigma factor